MIYRVWIVDEGRENAQEVETELDAGDAAEKFVASKEANDADYSVAAGHETVRVIVEDDAGNRGMFTVSGYEIPAYRAERIS